MLEKNKKLFKSQKDLADYVMWVWADFKDPCRKNNIHQQGFNRKELVDEYREEKLSYGLIKRFQT